MQEVLFMRKWGAALLASSSFFNIDKENEKTKVETTVVQRAQGWEWQGLT